MVRLQTLSQLYRLDLERATLAMKKKASQIDEALASDSQETILDNPEKFQEFVSSFEKEIRAGNHKWCEKIDSVLICE